MPKTLRTLAVCALVCATTSLSLAALDAEDAHAQVAYCTGAACLITTSTSTTSTGITIALAVVFLNDGKSDTAQLTEYMKHNRVALLDALHVGGGEALDDLATLMLVDPNPADRRIFERVVRDHRRRLVDVLLRQDDVDRAQADDFVAVVIEGLEQGTRRAPDDAS